MGIEVIMCNVTVFFLKTQCTHLFTFINALPITYNFLQRINGFAIMRYRNSRLILTMTFIETYWKLWDDWSHQATKKSLHYTAATHTPHKLAHSRVNISWLINVCSIFHNLRFWKRSVSQCEYIYLSSISEILRLICHWTEIDCHRRSLILVTFCRTNISTSP